MLSNITYQIRPVQPEDLNELLKLIEEHAAYERATFVLEDKKEKLHKALFDACRLNCWVVAVSNGLAGFVTYTIDYSTWDAADFMYMDCLFLKEEMRGSGIGIKIVELLKIIADERGCANIQWQTPVFNEPAIRFYKKIGAHSKEKVRFTLISNQCKPTI